jgi:hypothetical protein
MPIILAQAPYRDSPEQHGRLVGIDAEPVLLRWPLVQRTTCAVDRRGVHPPGCEKCRCGGCVSCSSAANIPRRAVFRLYRTRGDFRPRWALRLPPDCPETEPSCSGKQVRRYESALGLFRNERRIPKFAHRAPELSCNVLSLQPLGMAVWHHDLLDSLVRPGSVKTSARLPPHSTRPALRRAVIGGRQWRASVLRALTRMMQPG